MCLKLFLESIQNDSISQSGIAPQQYGIYSEFRNQPSKEERKKKKYKIYLIDLNKRSMRELVLFILFHFFFHK